MTPSMRNFMSLVEGTFAGRLLSPLKQASQKAYRPVMSAFSETSASSLIVEQAIAKPGDWDGAMEMITSISKFIFNTHWKIVGSIKVDSFDYDIASFSDASIYFVVGRMIDMQDGEQVTPRFAVIFKIELGKEPEAEACLGYSNIHRVHAVAVQPEMRGQELSRRMYQWLVLNREMTILGDRIQYFGARRLWSALSRGENTKVDLVDLKAEEVLEKGVKLVHGTKDHEFDERVWSYGRELINIRLALRKA